MLPWWSLTLGVAVLAAAATHLLARRVRHEGRAVRAASKLIGVAAADLTRRRRPAERTVQANPSQ